ncbi:hypothetical protein LX15_001411 [Streptoalloteichus tenebrarius]|uniref:Uncharacterized protein n=1 Tax=Streptoalloteichus tenebrarius (strain ATCC 17920 / DSM 40477 / JCM 4838 / CBS 697.72 / NBRC 16177 / NCIMB 11028 / NRRL B-12390 / A12253. 1 / ISP 5477) TaxID=1933 RepID=A0ABT1HQE2_STRSD|nr:hypothetical protein [Streptoalloteichus tenebrarius]MCP2257725.1 hypothetical protein [Streptoalloteichus tenebrarius]BFE99921.1 hypothetical protein GCM10020241_15970 [Streptoalloteichus tenebrarius]
MNDWTAWTAEGANAEVNYRRELLMAVAATAHLHRPDESWVTLQRAEAGLADLVTDDEEPELGPEHARPARRRLATWFARRTRPAATAATAGKRACTA